MKRSFAWGEVVVVADGLGSRSKADVGSRAACSAVIETAKFMVRQNNPTMENILKLIHAHWLMIIDPYMPEDCLTTCLFAIRNQNHCLLGQIGDGMLAIIGENDQESFVLSEPGDSAFSNITESLGRQFHPLQWKTRILPVATFKVVVLCTDGISDDLMPNMQLDFAEAVHSEYQATSSRQRTRSIQSWLKNWPVPLHSDDKTIACLHKIEKD